MASRNRPVTTDEPTAWMRTHGAIRYRAALIFAAPTLMTGGTVIVPIGRSGIGDPIEDRTCDRCRRHCPPDDTTMHVFTLEYEVPAGGRVIVTGGLCHDCARLETPEAAA